jgi:hypothetical protein
MMRSRLATGGERGATPAAKLRTRLGSLKGIAILGVSVALSHTGTTPRLLRCGGRKKSRDVFPRTRES